MRNGTVYTATQIETGCPPDPHFVGLTIKTSETDEKLGFQLPVGDVSQIVSSLLAAAQENGAKLSESELTSYCDKAYKEESLRCPTALGFKIAHDKIKIFLGFTVLTFYVSPDALKELGASIHDVRDITLT